MANSGEIDVIHQEREARAMDRRRALRAAAVLALGVGPALFASTPEALARDAKSSGNSDKGKKKDRSRGKKSRKQKASGKGKSVVKVAMKYKGDRYVMGGESPGGFDCSGFTWFVFDKATGLDIGRVVEDQWKQGSAVGRGDWQAGDIVFFENTFKRGLSHCGIYIGGGDFIHAENEDTGVVISNLQSGYYDDHYAGARRLL